MKALNGMLLILLAAFWAECAHAQIPVFHDIATSAGVANDDLSVGAAFLDVNNDGLDDIHLINDHQPGDSDHLFLNQGDLTFTDITESAGVANPPFSNSVRVADFDNDGWQDMFISTSNMSEGNKLYRNNGDNTFSDWFPQSGIRNYYLVTADWADPNRDGWVDFYYATHEWFPHGVIWGAIGAGEFRYIFQTPQVLWFICDAHFCDFDSDGDLDLLQGNFDDPSLVYRNDYPTCIEIATAAGLAGDSWNFKYHIVGDFNNDGFFDVYGLNFMETRNSPDCLYMQADTWQFYDAIEASGIPPLDPTYCGAAGDLDNDGWLDLLTLDATSGLTRFWHNNGNGTFTDVAPEAGLTGLSNTDAFVPVLGDINGDGFQDIYVVRYGPPNRLYLNDGNDNHWLQVSLQGTASNRLGIGGRVKAVAGELTQWRDLGGGNWGGSSNAPYVQIGLGAHAAADSLIVFWPSGSIDTLLSVAADQRIALVEGSGGVMADLQNSSPAGSLSPDVNPNPFNPTTAIGFELREASAVVLEVFNAQGRRVGVQNFESLQAGTHSVTCDGSNLPSGVYVYRLQAGELVASGKMVLMK